MRLFLGVGMLKEGVNNVCSVTSKYITSGDIKTILYVVSLMKNDCRSSMLKVSWLKLFPHVK
jgi:hypothetical protein